MTIEEIFKNEMELLENDNVKTLLAYVMKQHKRNIEIHKRLRKQEDDILELFMHSEIILIGGKSSRETLELIGDVLNK